MQIAGQAKGMAAGVDELLQRIGALRGVAEHGDPGTGPNLGDAGPQMRQQQVAVLDAASAATNSTAREISSGSIHATPQLVGRTEGGFYNVYEVNEKVQAFAYKTANYPAPKVRLSNPTSDPLKLQNGAIQDGVVGGFIVGLD